MSNTIRIESLDKEITFNPYTHRIAREYKQALLEGVTVGTNQSGETPNIDLPIVNQIRAEELQLKAVSGLTQNEIDSITEDEYNTLLGAVNEFIATKKK